MAVTERTTLAILARQAHAAAFQQQGAEGQRLPHCPVDALAGIDHGLLGFQLARDLGVHLEARGGTTEGDADLLQDGFGDGGGLFGLLEFAIGGGKTGPMPFQPVRLVGFVGLAGGVGVFQGLREIVPHRLGFGGRHSALGGQAFGV